MEWLGGSYSKVAPLSRPVSSLAPSMQTKAIDNSSLESRGVGIWGMNNRSMYINHTPKQFRQKLTSKYSCSIKLLD